MHLLYISTLHQQPIVLIAHIGTSQKIFQRRDAVVRRFLWGIAGATQARIDSLACNLLIKAGEGERDDFVQLYCKREL